ncbi:MAG TPA: malto-oligosyltrehalose synthase [Ohtaekwangia sp.]|nr:malto-oligosyltrehalose synthase [Ohtaekwangia sp.]
MRIPSSTYRIQFNKSFTLENLKEILDYLYDLGITTVYASPLLGSTSGSMHGYDVTDPHQIDAEIGTMSGLQEIARILHEKNMTWVQDIVPNHMAFTTQNDRLMDVLERGADSPYYEYFDINWNHHESHLRGKLMIPFLGKTLEECLLAGEIKLGFSEQGLTIRYYDAHYPVSIQTWAQLKETLNSAEWESAIDELLMMSRERKNLSEWILFKEQWLDNFRKNNLSVNAIKDWIVSVNERSEKLANLLDQQYFVLTHWQETERHLNYRRFFTVNSLICLRMEADEVFKEYHQFIYMLYLGNLIHGLRIDHIDGLNDPAHYIKKLRKLFGDDCYIIAEKILEAKEEMPEHWPLEGTSGYEFLSMVNQLFTDRHGAAELVRFYRELVPGLPAYEDLVIQNKKMILTQHMGGELNNVVHYFFELGLQGELSYEEAEQALSLIMLSLPVYRIYPDKLPLQGTNLLLLQEAFTQAKKNLNANVDHLDYLFNLFTSGDHELAYGQSVILFLRRLMQFTGPLTAKGVEDTTFYIYNPLISHDEVGDAPAKLGISIQSFHNRMIKRLRNTPLSLNATATHDTKRGEDARVRLNLLSEMPHAWIAHVKSWYALNQTFLTQVNGERAPSVNDEYFIYQAMVGGFPEDLKITEEWISRVQEYMIKVVREAKVISSWEKPDEAYETACADFIQNIMQRQTAFSTEFIAFMKMHCAEAWTNSAAQALVKIAAPGIPDIYQGCELYDLSFVDPDNRRPVDYKIRKQYLAEIKRREGADDFFSWLLDTDKQLVKMFTVYKMLHLRKAHPILFNEGAYIPLEVDNTVLAFARAQVNKWLVVVIPLGETRKNQDNNTDLSDICISLPQDFPKNWTNLLTGEKIMSRQQLKLNELVGLLPFAVLTSFDD